MTSRLQVITQMHLLGLQTNPDQPVDLIGVT